MINKKIYNSLFSFYNYIINYCKLNKTSFKKKKNKINILLLSQNNSVE